MAGLERQYQTDTKFRVISGKGSHFKLSVNGMVTGRMYNMPGQFHTYYGHASMSLDIRTYGNWKGELRYVIYSRHEDDSRKNGDYITYFLMPWSGYDLTGYSQIDLPIQSCKLSYSADFLFDDVQYTANIVDQEVMQRVHDLEYLHMRIGSLVRPRFSEFIYNSSGGQGGGTVIPVSIRDPYGTLPQPLPESWMNLGYVVPVHMIDGTRSDNYAGGTYTVTSSVNIELVE